jgi:serine phosphatase RsbU (regulator of sigma subunit)
VILPRPILRALVIPFIIVVFVIPVRAFTAWYAEVTLKNGAATQRLFRDFQYQRTRLGLLQMEEETAVRGYVITGDRRYLEPFQNAGAAWNPTANTVRDELRVLKLPSSHLDELLRLHDRWIAAVARPSMENPRRPDTLAIQERGRPMIDAFRRSQIAFHAETAAAADAADKRLLDTIGTTLLFGGLASVVVVAAAFLLMFYQLRSAQELMRIDALYRNEKRVADALQEAFQQKHLPQPPGVVLNATYVPAATSARVGGDWYDAFELPTGRVLFSIGDVAGHGIEAAVVMTRARQAILAAALQENDPARVLERANATIFLQDGVMVTAICGFIDPHNGEIVYATAGHPAPVLARAAKAATMLPSDGVPLGIFADSKYRTFNAQAAPDDVLVLYTDGVIEFERDPVRGVARLLETAARAATSANPAVELFAAVFGSNQPLDDVAILTASFTAG